MRSLSVFLLLVGISLPLSGCAPLDLISHPFKSSSPSSSKGKEAPPTSTPADREKIQVEDLPPPAR